MRVWRQMEQAVDAGHCRTLGVSNCYVLRDLERLCIDARIKPAVVQNRFYRDTGYDKELRSFCRANTIQYQSFWTLTANPRPLQSRALSRVAKAHNCTPEQAWFSFVRSLGIVPLTGTCSK